MACSPGSHRKKMQSKIVTVGRSRSKAPFKKLSVNLLFSSPSPQRQEKNRSALNLNLQKNGSLNMLPPKAIHTNAAQSCHLLIPVPAEPLLVHPSLTGFGLSLPPGMGVFRVPEALRVMFRVLRGLGITFVAASPLHHVVECVSEILAVSLHIATVLE